MANVTTQPTPNADVWGTSVTQGFRIGPSAEDEGSRPTGSATGSIRYELDQWGPGVYTGGLFTYRILPFGILEDVTSVSPNFFGRDNIVPQFTWTAGSLPKYLPLGTSNLGSPRPTTLLTVNAKPKMVLDYPRTINLYSDSSQAATLNVNVYGSDIYGQKMMETIQLVGTGAATGDVIIATGNKAFAQVDYVYFAGITGGTAVTATTFCVGVSNVFGLPYSINQSAHMIAYSQSDIALDALTIAGWQEGSFAYPYTNASGVLGDPYLICNPQALTASDPSTAQNAGSADVRGTVYPQTKFAWTTPVGSGDPYNFDGPVTSATNGNWFTDTPYVTLTYYIAGADMYQNQILAQREAIKGLSADPDAVATMWATVSPLRNQDGIKGQPQYWEEPPVV